MKNFTLQDDYKSIGKLTFRNYEIASKRAQEIDAFLRTAHNIPSELWERLMTEMRDICKVRTMKTTNIVVLSGRAMIAARLNGETTYTGAINYGALGTSATAVNAADVALTAEVARKLFSRRTRAGAQNDFDFFYSQADTNGTYQEFGMFIDGSVTVNSGQMFNHALTGGWVKTATEAMTVSVQINTNDT